MKTLLILLAGWVVGGAAIALVAFAMDERAIAQQPGRTAAPSVPGPQSAGALRADARAILIPVLGISPADITDTFTQARSGGRVHNALDILAPRGTPVVAAVDGTIRKLFNSRAGGLTIYQFDDAEVKVYYYAHLDSYAAGVREGMRITRGTVIGYVGTTGNAAPDAPHLHFAIELLSPTKEWWKGTPINPYPVLMAQ